MLPEDARPATTHTFKMGSCTACGVVHILGDFCGPDWRKVHPLKG